MADKPRIVPDPVFQTDHKEPTPQELADQFAALAVEAALQAAPDGLDILSELARKTGISPVSTRAAIADLQRLLGELNGRIDRQRKRIEKVQVTNPAKWTGRPGEGVEPMATGTAEMQTLLAELLENRRVLESKIVELQSGFE